MTRPLVVTHARYFLLAVGATAACWSAAPAFAQEASKESPSEAPHLFRHDTAAKKNFKLVRNFTGHHDKVTFVQFVPDGKRVLSVSDDGTMRVWQLESGQELLQIKGVEGPLKTVIIRDDGKALATGASKMVYICNLDTGAVEQTLSGPKNPIAHIGSSSNGFYVVALDDQGNGYTWDLSKAAGKQNVQSAPLPKHPSATGPLRQLRFDPQGGVWASGDFPHLVRWAVDIWKPAGKAVLATNSPARQFCISQDGTYLLAATDQTFCTAIRRSDGGDFERSVRTEHTSSLPKIQRILPAGADYFALLGGDGSIEFWRGRDDQFAGQFPAPVEGVTCVTYAPAVKMTLTGHADGSISLWSVDGLRERPESLQAELQLKFQKLLTEKKFDELTDELDRLRKAHAIIPNGNPALYAIDCQLASLRAGSDWDTLHATLAEWRAAKPKSIAPLIIEAEALKCEGWEARGSGFSNTVTQTGWQKFGEKLEQALKVIEEAEQLDEKDTELYRTQIGIFMGIGRPMEEIEAARKKAAEIDPDCYAVYEQEAVARLPRWGGGAPGEIAKWAGELCDNLKRHGDEVYARIAMQLTRYAKNDVFAESHLDWDRIKRGLDKLMEHFDDSSDFANDAAFMAILQLDHAEAKKVLPILGLNRRSSLYWSDGDQLRQWQKWAAADEIPVSQEQTRAIVIPQGATCAGLSAEGNLLVAIGTASGGFMQIRETKAWNTVWHNEHMGTDFSVLAVHPDGPLVAVSGGPIAPLNVRPTNYSCGAEIFDFTKGMPQVTGLHGGHGHTDLIKATAFSPDGESWATGSLDCDLKIWKIPLQHPLPSVLKQPSGVVGLTYSADGKSIAVATLKDGVLLWNLDAPPTPDKPPASKQLYSPDEGQALATSHDGTLLAYLNNDVRVTIYDWKAKSTVATLPEIKGNTFVIAFSPNDKFLATGGDANQVELWDAATGKHVATFTAHFEPIRSLAFFPTRPELLSLAGDGTVRIWDVSKYMEK